MKSFADVAPRELRKFGIAFTVFLSLIMTVILWKRSWHMSSVTWTLVTIAALFLAVAIVRPSLLKQIYIYWTKLAG